MPIDNNPNSFLMVPIKLDALFVPADGLSVVGASEKFSKLPTAKMEDGDIKTSQYSHPYISETVLTDPFIDQSHLLNPGMHLHWALPDALTKASYKKGYKFPVCPNRWLVLKFKNKVLSKKWLVCSDYLWPEGTMPWDESNPPEGLKGIQSPYVTFHHLSPDSPTQYPYRYQGWVKAFSPNDTSMEMPAGDFLPIEYTKTDEHGHSHQFMSDDLTVIGNGDPHHAAFYPNCQNIFGMRDSDITAKTDLTEIRYEVYGWYQDSNKDILKVFIDDHEDTENWINTLEEELGWTVNTASLPNKILCHSNIKFDVSQAPPYPEVLRDLDFNKDPLSANPTKTELAIGNTGTEALSAFLANKIDATDALRIENQIESLHLQSSLLDKNTDLTAYFEEAKHTKTFKSIAGGRLWAYRVEASKESGQDQLRNPEKDNMAGRLFLPTGMKEKLDETNKLQQKFDRSNTAIKELKQHIFTSWHRYMRATYHNPYENKKDFPSIDEVREYIEKKLALLSQKEAYAGTISFNEETGIWVANEMEIMDTLIQSIDHLIPGIETEFNTWFQLKKSDQSEAINHSLAKEIADGLNYMSDALRNYNALIDQFRDLLKNLSASAEFPNEEDEINFLNETIRKIETAIHDLSDGVLLPDQNTRIQNAFSGDLETRKKTLKSILSSLAALPKIEIIPINGPRYWQPKEPVLLMAGPALKSTDRHGTDHINSDVDEPPALNCQAVKGVGLSKLKKFTSKNNENNRYIYKEIISRNQLENRGNGAPWHPLFFEWEVRIDPLQRLSNNNPASLKYDKDFITTNYTLKDTKSGFIRSGNNDSLDGTSYFKGRSTLLPYAPELLLQEIEDFIIQESKAYVTNKKEQTDEEKDLLQLLVGDRLQAADTPLDDLINGQGGLIDLESAIVSNKRYRAKWLDYFKNNQDPIIANNSENNEIPSNPLFDRAGLTDVVLNSSNSFFQSILSIRKNLEEFQEADYHIQTQALSGFNEALLSLKKTAQLEISEPNGFVAYKAFSQRVATELGANNILAAEEDQDFHPIRNGNLHLNRLLLVDTFGQVHAVVDQTATTEQPVIYAPETMKLPAENQTDQNTIVLPPRITQASRLNFRWLAANDPDLESNAHPDTSPICGWVVVNKIDLSLMIYSAEGFPLGAVEDTGRWRPTPGRQAPQSPQEISNPALQKLTRWIMKEAPKLVNTPASTSFFDLESPEDSGSETTFLEHFIDDLEKIMQDIAPDVTSMDPAKALLIGTPIALVQAAVDVQLKGWPAINQSLDLFKQVIQGNAEYSDSFTEVEIPIRIGEQYRLNDGVLAYWLDSDQGYIEDKVRAPFNPRKHTIQTEIEDDEITFTRSISAPTQGLAILMDPRGLLHCTTGILPTKSLSIPTKHYAAALERIQVTFQLSPIISESRNINIPLPQEAGYDWYWLQKDEEEWTELSSKPIIRKADLQAAFEDGESVWNMLLNNGWMDLNPEHNQLGSIRKVEDRDNANLPIDSRQLEELEKVLQIIGRSVKPSTPQAHFQSTISIKKESEGTLVSDASYKIGSTTEIREGWLSLRPNTLS